MSSLIAAELRKVMLICVEFCSILWDSLDQGNLGEKGYMCMYGWVPPLFTWSCHNVVNWLCAVLSHSVVSDSLQPHGLEPARLLCPWGFSREEYWSELPCPPSRGSSQRRDWTQVSHVAGRFFTSWATREAHEYWSGEPIPSPGDLPDPGIEPGSPSLQMHSLPAELPPQYKISLKEKGLCSYTEGLCWVQGSKAGSLVRTSACLSSVRDHSLMCGLL